MNGTKRMFVQVNTTNEFDSFSNSVLERLIKVSDKIRAVKLCLIYCNLGKVFDAYLCRLKEVKEGSSYDFHATGSQNPGSTLRTCRLERSDWFDLAHVCLAPVRESSVSHISISSWARYCGKSWGHQRNLHQGFFSYWIIENQIFLVTLHIVKLREEYSRSYTQDEHISDTVRGIDLNFLDMTEKSVKETDLNHLTLP